MSNASNHPENAVSLAQQLARERNVIDNDIVKLRHELHQLEMRRNMKALINARLPPEVLSNIFCYVKNMMIVPTTSNPQMHNHSHTVKWVLCVSHICSYWRSVALSSPSLWTDGFPGKIGGIETFLGRSRGLPISLDRNITASMLLNDDIRALVSAHMGRAKKICLNTHRSNANGTAVMKMLNLDMPHLTSLHLSLPDSSTGGSPLRSYTLPRPENLNHVRDIFLVSCGFDWSKVELNNLTSLSLTGSLLETHKATVAQIHAILERSPNIQTLELFNAITDDAQDEGITPSRLTMTHLKVFRVWSEGAALAKKMINPTTLPSVESIALNISTSDESTMVYLLCTSAQLVSRHKLPVAVGIDARSIMDKQLFTYAHDPSDDESLIFSNIWNHDHPIDIARATLLSLSRVDLSQLNKFDCSIRHPLSADWWTGVLGHSKHLKNLHTEGLVDPSPLINALTPSANEVERHARNARSKRAGRSRGRSKKNVDNDGLNGAGPSNEPQESTVFLPCLDELKFCNVRFTPNRSGGGRSSRDNSRNNSKLPFEDGSFKHLAHCLKLRKDCGHKQSILAIPGTSEDHHRSGARLNKLVRTLMHSEDVFDQDFGHWFQNESDEDLDYWFQNLTEVSSFDQWPMD